MAQFVSGGEIPCLPRKLLGCLDRLMRIDMGLSDFGFGAQCLDVQCQQSFTVCLRAQGRFVAFAVRLSVGLTAIDLLRGIYISTMPWHFLIDLQSATHWSSKRTAF